MSGYRALYPSNIMSSYSCCNHTKFLHQSILASKKTPDSACIHVISLAPASTVGGVFPKKRYDSSSPVVPVA